MIGIGRILGIWTATAFLMTANGMFREMVLARVVTRTTADVASAFVGIAIVLGVTRYLLRSIGGPISNRERLKVGAIWLLLTVAFEFSFGHYVDRKSWSVLLENYAIWHGHLWPIVLAAFVTSPFIWLRHKSALPDR